MSRADRRNRGERGPKEPRAKSSPDLRNTALRDLRFDTPESSAMFLKLRYLDSAYTGSKADGIRLPPLEESVSVTASSGGMVYKAFPHGLMYGDQMSLMAGAGLFIGGIVLLPYLQHLIFGGDNLFSILFVAIRAGGGFNAIVLTILILLMLAVAPVALFVVISDLNGFRFNTSALFDRNAGKIHLFADQSMPWAPWRYQLKTYDWRCVRGEVDTVTFVTGPLIRKEAGLRCVVMDRPGGDTVVDQFVLGVNMPAQHIQPLLDTWEHVRRFMQHEGPLFADQHDQPNTSLGRQPLWKHLLSAPKLHVWGIKEMFQIAWEDQSPFAALTGFVGIILLPFIWIFVLWGFLPWLSGLAKRDPIWPAEIIASVGGASLSGKDLDAWRGVMPEMGQKITAPRQPKLDVD